jgi:hypothetical protein
MNVVSCQYILILLCISSISSLDLTIEGLDMTSRKRGHIAGTPGDYNNDIGAKRCVSSLSFVTIFQSVHYLNFPLTYYVRQTKRSVSAFLKLFDSICARWHLRIPHDYMNGISGILNVSFCSSCLFRENVVHRKNLPSCGRYTKHCVFAVFLRDLALHEIKENAV